MITNSVSLAITSLMIWGLASAAWVALKLAGEIIGAVACIPLVLIDVVADALAPAIEAVTITPTSPAMSPTTTPAVTNLRCPASLDQYRQYELLPGCSYDPDTLNLNAEEDFKLRKSAVTRKYSLDTKASELHWWSICLAESFGRNTVDTFGTKTFTADVLYKISCHLRQQILLTQLAKEAKSLLDH